MTIDDRRPGLRPPQFRLSTLMWAIAVIGAVLASFGYLGPHVTSLLILFGLAVAAHLAGAMLGTRLRANGDRPLPRDEQTPLSAPVRRPPAATDFAPATRLRDRRSLGAPIVIATVSGFVIGGPLGMVALVVFSPQRPALAALLLGGLACGVLAAIWTFMAFGFLQVSLGALWQATRGPKSKS